MMSFWAEKIAEMQPQQPTQRYVERQPTSWLGLGQNAINETAPQQPQNAPQQAQTPPGGNYAPPTSGYVQEADEVCPRCKSEDYVLVPPDAEFGGVRAGVQQPKRCFSCRYPGANPSGSLVRAGMGGAMKGTKIKQLEVRQAGGGLDGIWSDASWENAPLVA
jgi:hypothetical protein